MLKNENWFKWWKFVIVVFLVRSLYFCSHCLLWLMSEAYEVHLMLLPSFHFCLLIIAQICFMAVFLSAFSPETSSSLDDSICSLWVLDILVLLKTSASVVFVYRFYHIGVSSLIMYSVVKKACRYRCQECSFSVLFWAHHASTQPKTCFPFYVLLLQITLL